MKENKNLCIDCLILSFIEEEFLEHLLRIQLCAKHDEENENQEGRSMCPSCSWPPGDRCVNRLFYYNLKAVLTVRVRNKHSK